jgi:multiple sugar transport system ATP-binding protein
VRDPQVFLFDEPLSIVQAARGVHRDQGTAVRLKTTTVYVTHDQIEPMTMADRLWSCTMAWSSRWARRSGMTAGEPLRRGLHRLAAMNFIPARVSRASVSFPRSRFLFFNQGKTRNQP